ncbi:Nn.00g064040.m01.CDS01 [Neocucurbitaria sp. VM-36]
MVEKLSKTVPRMSALTRADDLTTVKIGPEHTTYHIHKALLVHYSDYFRKALDPSWKEGQDRKVVIDDLEPESFDVFVDWLYRGGLAWDNSNWSNTTKGGTLGRAIDAKPSNLCLVQVKCYVMADRLGAFKLQRVINNQFVAQFILQPPWYGTIIYAFNNIPSERPILRFLIDTHCYHWQEAFDKQFPGEEVLQHDLPRDFLLRAMKRMREMCNWGSRKLNPNDYLVAIAE